MIAVTEVCLPSCQPTPAPPSFEKLLPAVRDQAAFAFRFFPRSQREELIAETVANAYCAYQRLVERGKAELAYATPLAMYAVRQVRAGRRVGTKMNVRDPMSEYCRAKKGIKVESLDRYDRQEKQWQQMVVEDRRCGPDQIAATRIDFAAWLKTLPRRMRRIALELAAGETTHATARQFKLSAARISQIRRELKAAWETFQGECKLDVAAA